jgi:c-di-GMP-binding flagellar brake protein YcgR
MKVLMLETRNQTRYMWLLQKAIAQKNQRREAFRLPIMFDVEIFEHVDDGRKNIVNGVIFEEPDEAMYETASCRDLSATGVALTTKQMYLMDERYHIKMYFDRTPANIRAVSKGESAPPLSLTAIVKRCIPWRDTKYYNTGLHFVSMSRNTSESISRFVLAEQQKQIKKRRLV